VSEQFFHFLISPFSKGRYKGICFYFFSLSTTWERGKERGGDCIQATSCIPSPSPLTPLPSKGEGIKKFLIHKFPSFLKGETG